jgi:hypothetical protein
MLWVSWMWCWCLTMIAGFSLAPSRPRDVSNPLAQGDLATLDAIVAELYSVISGPSGKVRDWDRFRSLFRPDAKLMAAVPGEAEAGRLVSMTPDEYVTRNGDYLVREGFFETELARRTESFGAIAQVFSTYETRLGEKDAKPYQRGINSIQLWFDGKRWWILSLVWQAETERHKLPAKYRARGSG